VGRAGVSNYPLTQEREHFPPLLQRQAGETSPAANLPDGRARADPAAIIERVAKSGQFSDA
jgi:hypothetical protein